MRLHSLRLQAFGPYAAEQVIDFGRLAGSGLFLLEGPTGAGKSTVLDAVTFALYGGLAAASASDDRLHSDFADPGVEPSVTCEFSLRGLAYRITRVPEHRRPKKRGDGYTTEPPRVHLERREGGGWASLSANKAEAGALITEIVGLNRDQFTQVMLLPQGEFARFLRCGDDERRAVLTKLFGTGLYDRVTAELDRRRGDAVRARERSAREIDAVVSAAAEAAGLDEAARASLLALPGADRGAPLKEIADQLAATAADGRQALARAQALLAAATTAEQGARREAELAARLAEGLARLAEHEAGRKDWERDKARLAAARHAEPVRPLLTSLAAAEKAAGQAAGQARQAVAEAGKGHAWQAAVDTAAGPATAGGDPFAQEGAGTGAPAKERGRAGDPGQVTLLAREVAAAAEAAELDAAGLGHLVGEEAELPDRQAALTVLEDAAESAQARVARLEGTRGNLPALIAGLEEEWQQERERAGGLGAARVRLETVARQQAAAARAAELSPEVEAARVAMQEAVDRHQALVDEHQRVVEARLAGMAAELAATLTDGTPCPVCGAPDHPAPAAGQGEAVTPGVVNSAAERRDRAASARADAQAEHARLAQEQAASVAMSGGADLAGLTARAAELAAAIGAAEKAAGQAARLERELDQRRAELESSADQVREAGQRAAAARERAAAARQALAALQTHLAQAAGDHPSVAARQAALREGAAGDRALAQALDLLATALTAQAKAHEQAEAQARSGGFASLAMARGAALAPAEQDALASRIDSWTQTLAGLTAAVRTEELAGLDPGRADDAQDAARAAAAALAGAREAEQATRRAHDVAAARQARFGELTREVRAAEDAHDALVERTGPVIALAGLAKGVTGQRRVALTTYVLRYWFSQVVAAANIRLSAASSGRYLLKRTDEGETRRDRSGLTLAVIDRHTGEQRSPASLSGGETFYTSLALALGLADVVKAEAGGVDLDTLFIDEGFGSLDAETLDQVMAVIDELRDRGRVVGIVSHLADLKDRVPERLEVRRLPDGSSTARVVA